MSDRQSDTQPQDLGGATSTRVEPASKDDAGPTSHVSSSIEPPSTAPSSADDYDEWKPRGPIKQNTSSGTKNTNIRR
ncbi:uncharacterized protein B0H18DRAFT_1017956 [Fomitopsis serialis]|uniref:uncharacterized protein n=1 Tax=Fomitopsis serialis TaxID=139415 RepID=UPI002007FB50|nr:uncharacterized protein B0H18DRAFT_1017956 [Neoantrodia serialis]KAH9922514.1 hypothetical protein B0H18DRAFT_1017956 [Neoantrodia serialis]